MTVVVAETWKYKKRKIKRYTILCICCHQTKTSLEIEAEKTKLCDECYWLLGGRGRSWKGK